MSEQRGTRPDVDGSHEGTLRSLSIHECSIDSSGSVVVGNLSSQTPSTPATTAAHGSWCSVAAKSVKQNSSISIRRIASNRQLDENRRQIEQSIDCSARTITSQASEGWAAPISNTASRLDFIRTHDWREQAPAQQPVAPRATQITQVNLNRLKSSFRPGPRTISGQLYEDLIPGTVIWHYDVRPLYGHPQSPGLIIFEDDQGRQMTKKGRYFVIVENLIPAGDSFEVNEVAIFTNQDTGLQPVNPANHYKYFSVCPEHIDVDDFKNLSPTNPVLKIDWMHPRRFDENQKLRSTMVLNWYQLRKTDINLPEMRIIGILDNASREVLCNKVLSSSTLR